MPCVRLVSLVAAERPSSRVDRAYILMAVHTERLDLLDGLDIVIVGLLPRAVGGRSNLVDLLPDGLEVVGRGDAIGRAVCLCLIGRHLGENMYGFVGG